MRLLLASLLFVTACAGTASYSATGSISTPDLVVIEPGVQVIADYDEPIFYSENYYWRNDGGRWYRSSYHNRGWVVYEAPQRVRSISQPNRYRRYKPAGYQPKSSRPAPYRPAPSNQARPDHDNRDHDKHYDKDDRKEDKRDRKEERKEDKRDRKEDRKEDKRDRKDDKYDRKD